MSKQAQELKDLDVDRVDLVDKPATGRSFLLFKSEDAAGKPVSKTVDGTAVMKGYGMTATAADLVLKAFRNDSQASVSRKSAIALNGLAQILGQEPVFVGKSVPTQPYMITEPDVDQRGPADEDLGANFTPRAMPGSQVGSVSFRMKEDDGDAKEMFGGKKKAAEVIEDATKPAAKAAESGAVETLLTKMLASMEKNSPEAIAKAVIAAAKADESGQVTKGEDEPVEKVRSKQVQADDEPVRVRKGRSDYEPRFETSFADICFKK